MKIKPPLNVEKSIKEFTRAKSMIPGGVLGIRRPYNFVEGEYPIYFQHGKGGHITDIDGNEYIDMLCAYGPIIIGHRETEIDQAVMHAIAHQGFCFSLTQTIQNDLAERLCNLIPSAEACIFLKTGSDATTAAVRIARAYTGRTKVIRCGYHGWHDWCVEVKAGVPPSTASDTLEFEYNNIEQLRNLLDIHGTEVATIIITPIGHPLAHQVQEPQPDFLNQVQTLAKKYGIVLTFDEIRTGFRIDLKGAQAYYGIIPDLSVFGKAMANGYPISAVVGSKAIMNVLEKDVFISSTFFANGIEQLAALKTIDFLEKYDVIATVRVKGQRLLAALLSIAADCQAPIEISPVPSMPFITFNPDPEKKYKNRRQLFYTYLIREGIFLQPYHHGYIAFRHTDEDLTHVETCVRDALLYLKQHDELGW